MALKELKLKKPDDLKEILYEHKILTLLNQNNIFLKYFGLFKQNQRFHTLFLYWWRRVEKDSWLYHAKVKAQVILSQF